VACGATNKHPCIIGADATLCGATFGGATKDDTAVKEPSTTTPAPTPDGSGDANAGV